MQNLQSQLEEIGIVPVVKIDDVSHALPLAQALINGGIPCAEITFRTDAAADAIKAIHEAFPNFLLGAGTVLTTEQVDQAIEAGATFIVAPGLNPKIVEYCIEKEIAVVPGVATASEIEQALSLGLNFLKFFPAEVNGGIPAINALTGPYQSVKFMPTGGINKSNLKDYVSNKKVVACGGTWMVNDSLLNTNNFDEIERLSLEAVEIVKSARQETL